MQTIRSSPKELFLNALCTKNLKALEQILEEDITYFGASKKTFLKRISYIFDQLKRGGQNGVLKLKQHKKQYNTYYLYSNAFNVSFKFIIEDDNGKLLNVYNNKKVNSIEDAEGISEFDFYFGEDERVGFEPSDVYLVTLFECINAYNELENDNVNVISREDINNWLGKHSLLFDKVYPQYQYFKFNGFRYLYSIFEGYYEILLKYDMIVEALNDFNKCEIDEIDDWCEHYNRLYFCETMSFQGLPLIIDRKNRRIRFHNKSNIYFYGDDFFAIVRFNEIFSRCFDIRGENTSWY
jgi:hypothetical protein